MDDMINRHDSIAEENIEPNGRPATNEFEEWSDEVSDRADNVFKKDKKEGPVKDREKRIKEMDEVIKKEGDNSGDNYIAYTYFIKNDGEQKTDYKSKIVVESVIKNVDDAVRVAVFTNGEKKVYAKKAKNGKEEPNTIAFLSNHLIMEQERNGLEPGQMDRYTILVWLEGKDPECIDDIIGGEMKMSMVITEKSE